MDFASLEIFRAVAAESSVTRAAERLKRVQSNVTTRIQQLEDDLGAKLFLREGKRMKMPVSVEVHHALVDGLDVARFFERFAANLDRA